MDHFLITVYLLIGSITVGANNSLNFWPVFFILTCMGMSIYYQYMKSIMPFTYLYQPEQIYIDIIEIMIITNLGYVGGILISLLDN